MGAWLAEARVTRKRERIMNLREVLTRCEPYRCDRGVEDDLLVAGASDVTFVVHESYAEKAMHEGYFDDRGALVDAAKIEGWVVLQHEEFFVFIENGEPVAKMLFGRDETRLIEPRHRGSTFGYEAFVDAHL